MARRPLSRRDTLISTMLAAGFLAPTAAVAAEDELYGVDNGHSTVLFSATHLGVGQTWGRFNEVEGSFSMDGKAPSAVDITIKVDSIDSHLPKRDDHLKGPDFFNSKQFPVITFKGSEVKAVDADTWEVTGELSLHGRKKTVTVPVDKVGEGPDPWGGYRAGLQADFLIKRSDFGITHMADGISDDIRLIVALEGKKK